MKIEGVRQERFVTELRCDRCSRAALNGESEFDEFTSIDFTAGYGSVFGDGDTVAVDLCQHCLQETLGAWLRVSAPLPSGRLISRRNLADVLREVPHVGEDDDLARRK